jgi:hypothetical protein
MWKESTPKMIFDWIKAKGIGHEFTTADLREETGLSINILSAAADRLHRSSNIEPVGRKRVGLAKRPCLVYRVVDLTRPKFHSGQREGIVRARRSGYHQDNSTYLSFPIQGEKKPEGRVTKKRVAIEKPMPLLEQLFETPAKPLSERLFELAIEVEAMERRLK